MSQEQFQQRAGFDLHSFVKSAKGSMGVGKVRVMFDNPNAQAMSRYNGEVLEVHLPDIATIMRQRPELSHEEAVAKIKSATIEELCFTPDTIVLTEERAKPISDVQEGERLYKKSTLVTSGASQKVYLSAGFSSFNLKMERHYTGDVYSIKPSHFLPITCTPNHPFLIRRKLYQGKQEWIDARDIRVGDYLYFPLSNFFKEDVEPSLPDELMWSQDLARFLGYYLAEGNASGNKVVLSLGSYEADLIEDVLRIARTTFHRKAWVRSSNTERGVQVIFSHKELAAYLKRTFGHPARKKSLPTSMLRLPEHRLRALLWGYTRGDGSESDSTVRLISSSKALAVGLQLALLKLGIISGASSSHREGTGIRGRSDKNIHTWYEVAFSLNERSRRWARDIRLRKGYLVTRVKEVSTSQYDGLVYNFEMKGLPNYAVFPAIVHNCHGKHHETDHNEEVVSCTIGGMKAYLTPGEFALPYIQEKVQRLQAASSAVAGETL